MLTVSLCIDCVKVKLSGLRDREGEDLAPRSLGECNFGEYYPLCFFKHDIILWWDLHYFNQ